MPRVDIIQAINDKEKSSTNPLEAQPVAFIPAKYLKGYPGVYSITVLAATACELLTYPLDMTKTRLQIQGETAGPLTGPCVKNRPKFKNPVPERRMVQTLYSIAVEEGPLKIWRGLTPALYRHSIYTASMMYLYRDLDKYVYSRIQNKDKNIQKQVRFIGGLTAVCVSQLLVSPTDLVKVRMQMEGNRVIQQGLPPRVNKSANQTFVQMRREGGIKGMYKGAFPNTLRAGLLNFGDVMTHDHIKRNLLEKTRLTDGKTSDLLTCCGSGFVASALCTPPDVVKTRLMNQATDCIGKGLIYAGSWDCLKKTVWNEGIFALYKGFLPLWMKLTVWSSAFWVAYEQIENLNNLSMGGTPS